MKNVILALILSTSQVSAADLSYTSEVNDYPPRTMFEKAVSNYTDSLIIENVQEKCTRFLGLNMPKDRFIPNKQYFIMGFDPPIQEKIIAFAIQRARDYSDEETFKKGLNPGQILSQSAWCRLVGADLMDEAKYHLDRHLD
jgi:hypothetical protein